MIIFIELQRDGHSVIFYNTKRKTFFKDYYSSLDDISFVYEHVLDYAISISNIASDIYDMFNSQNIKYAALFGRLLFLRSSKSWYVFDMKNGELREFYCAE